MKKLYDKFEHKWVMFDEIEYEYIRNNPYLMRRYSESEIKGEI